MKLGETFAGLARGRTDLFELVDGPRLALTVIRCKVPRGQSHTGSIDEISYAAYGVGGAIALDETERNNFGAKQYTRDHYEAANTLTKKVCNTINGRGEIFLTGSMLDGLFVIRVVSANERAEE